MMKKFLVFAMLLGTTLLFAADKIVLCTTSPLTVYTKTILHKVPGFQVECLITPGSGCPHDYALKPADLKKVLRADVLVINGLGMESFLDGVLRKLTKKTLVIDSSKGVQKILKNGKEANPHLFAGPSTAAEVVKSIGEALAKQYPKQAETILANARSTAKSLLILAHEYQELGKKLPANRRCIVVQHGLFDYMAQDLGLTVCARLQEHDGQEPSAARILELVRTIREKKACLILTESGESDKAAKAVHRETNLRILPLEMNPDTTESGRMNAIFHTNLKLLKTALLND